MVKKVEHFRNSQCPVACTLDFLGDHWSLLVIRELMMMGNHQYKDMLAMPEGISSNILSDRLKRLEESGIIASAYRPNSKRDKLYYLTEKGKELFFVIVEIVRWADKHLGDKIHIPAERRAFIDNPPEEVAKTVFARLEEWEKQNLPDMSLI